LRGEGIGPSLAALPGSTSVVVRIVGRAGAHLRNRNVTQRAADANRIVRVQGVETQALADLV